MILTGQCSVIGETQSGKTTSAISLLRNQPGLKIFINTKWEKKWDRHFNVTSYSWERIMDFYNDYPMNQNFLFNYYPDPDSEYQDVSEMSEALLRRAQTDEDFEACIIYDEIYNMVSKQKRKHSILKIWTMGLGLGIKGIAVAQRPQQINNDILSNTEFWVLHYLPEASFELLTDFGISTKYKLLNWKTKAHKHPENPRRHGWCYVPHHFYVQTNAHQGLKKLKLLR